MNSIKSMHIYMFQTNISWKTTQCHFCSKRQSRTQKVMLYFPYEYRPGTYTLKIWTEDDETTEDKDQR